MQNMKKWPYAVLSTTLALSMLLTMPQSGALAATDEQPTSQAVTHDHDHDAEISPTLDTDGDGLTDVFEQEVTHAHKADTDGDGIPDSGEDTDGDGLSNLVEQQKGTNPLVKDSDGDRLDDYEEVYTHHTDPAKADTDGDNLSDGTEVLNYSLDPLAADQDGDGQLDGTVSRDFTIPANEIGITGTMSGMGDIPQKLTVRQSPILIVQSIQAEQSFDLESLDRTATFNIEMPVGKGEGDLRLFRYEANQATLTPVETQQVKGGVIAAEFTGGGSFVVLPMSEYKKSLRPDKAEYKGKFQKFSGKAKLHGLPNVEIDGAQVSADGTFTVKRGEDQAVYKIQDMQKSDGTTYVTASAIYPEAGKVPTILVHGFWGSSTTWGFNQKWSNGGDTPSAESAIYSYETFTGKTYASGTASTYSNIDVQYITSNSDSTEMGPILVGKGYTRNVDLFNFEYHSDGHVALAGQHLKNFIANLKSAGKIPSGAVNIIAHSKGGLVSRYFIENQSGSSSVARLTTLGTPHFGSDYSTFGDMDRDDSDLWLGNNNDAYCNTFTNSHPYTKYFAFGAFQASAGDLNATYPSQRGVWSVGQLSGSYDTDVRNRFKNAGNEISWWSYADVEDGVVNIDSAMGSDQEPDYDGTLPKVSIFKRWYIFHETYGDHSGMRKYSTVQNMVYNIQQGSYDY
ncbi:hypothetical protein OS242_12460 [Tumebacillus sp. DT12]|uniref:Alpha/beta hydrolase n=1 Tax=Tumebacillus lacus TaxID=2995335 RepID=A0ABT3X571_9BACL|nr:hypothetical protein [Tumebacillus lacus]MCX7570771.1 hypothetical protein [Tumebacillus lacus]